MALSAQTSGRLTVAFTVLSCLVGLSHQHAYLAYPESRNYQAYLIPPPESKYYCPHCGQGGGTGRTPGICGDPFQDVVGNANFVPFVNRFYRHTTLTVGQTINVRITVSTNHGGRMSVAVCPLAPGAATQDCFNQPQNRLRRVDANPAYNNKWYWYLTPANSQSAEATFKLPEGVTCENGCLFQWWWVGYQSCTLPCEDSSVDVPGECGKNPLNPSVSQCSSILQTEQFFNCADVIIKSRSNGSGGSPPSVRPSPFALTSPPPTIAVRPPSPPPPSPRPPSPKPPAPTPTPNPAPAPTPNPTPAPSGACPSGDWRCSACMQSAGQNAAASSGLVGNCFTCSTSGSEPSACAQCMTSSSSRDVVQGCLSCVSRGLPGWSCNQQCAQVAPNSAQMTGCVDCLGTPGINTWGCQNCLQLAGGDNTKASLCLACVRAGRDGWACGQCATKANAAQCYTCLASAGANTWPCIAA